MYCTFYRTEEIKTKAWENIIGKLHFDLMMLDKEEMDEERVCRYVYMLLQNAQPLENNPKMSFVGMWNPCEMPSDCRVEYVYKPTYIATAFMMKAAVIYPGFMSKEKFCSIDLYDKEFSQEEFLNGLKACMLGCTGRGFAGHGYDDLQGMIECMQLFAENRVGEFVELYPDVCPEFTDLFNKCITEVERRVKTNTVKNAWGADYTVAAVKLLKTLAKG